MLRRRLLLIGLAVITAGCGPAANATTPTPAERASAPAQAPCLGSELIGPDGERVDLTGTWEGFIDSLWFITQSGTCVSMEGLSNAPNEPLGTEHRFVFWGETTANFIVRGSAMCTWINPRVTDPVRPSLGEVRETSLAIEFDEAGEPLIRIDSRGFINQADWYVVDLERISTSTQFPE